MNTTGLTYIQVGEQQVKLKFGLPACQTFYNMCLAEDSENYINGTKLTARGIAKLFFAAYENACMIDDKDIELTFGKFLGWVEDTIIDHPKELERVVEVFSNSKYTTKMSERVSEKLDEDSKKKSIGNSSNPLPSMSSASPISNTSSALTGSSNFAKKGTNEQKQKKRKPKK